MAPRPVTVLLLAAGSPGDVTILRGLKRSSRYSVTLHAADVDPLKGNLYLPEVDRAWIVPRHDDPGYPDFLLDLVRETGADVLMSDLDEELPVLYQMTEDFREVGCGLFLPLANGLTISLDKLATARSLAGKITQPVTLPGEPECRDAANALLDARGCLILKPRFLRGGRGVDLVTTPEELDFFVRRHESRGPYIVQEYVCGDEYNVSSLHDGSGRLIYAATRIKMEDRLVKSNTIAAKVVDNPAVRDMAINAVCTLGLDRGFNNVELIVVDGMPFVIDVNGGRWAGQDMNLLESGVNQAELYLDLALGETVEPIDVPVGAVSLKIKIDVVVDEERIRAVALPENVPGAID